MLTAMARDGTQARAHDEGQGPTILILHPGMDDGSTWRAVSAILAPRFRVVIPHRRPYRLDLPSSTMDTELDHIRALVSDVDTPILLVGHSSGAVAALEALVDMPTVFAGAVLYDPPIATNALPFGLLATAHDPDSIVRAQAAVAAGRSTRAYAIIAREILKLPAPLVALSRLIVRATPRVRARVPSQVADAAAIAALGDRRDAYADISVPCVLLTGQRGPQDLQQRLTALARALPHAQRIALPRQGHSAHRKAPREVALVIENLAARVFSST